MDNKQGGMLLFAAGLLLAMITGYLAYSQLKAAETRVGQVPGQRVVVATQDIPEQGQVTLSAVAFSTISNEAAPEHPYSNVGEVVGKYARQPIYKGDILTEEHVVSLEQIRGDLIAGRPAPSPSMVLDKDQLMVVLPARMAGNFAGQSPNLLTGIDAIRAGDYVDVLLTTLELPASVTPQERNDARNDHPWDYLRTRVIFQNLRVYHVGPFPQASASNAGRGTGPALQSTSASRPEDQDLTFVVDRDTALALKWLKDLVALGEANVDFALRSPLNQTVVPAEPYSVQNMQRQFGVFSSP